MKELISLKCREGEHDRCWLDWCGCKCNHTK